MPILTCPKCGAKNRVDERAETARPICGRCGARLPIDGLVDTQPIIATDAGFDQLLTEAEDVPLLVDCWAPWCGPCRMLTPTIEQLAAESSGRWFIAKLNVDENPRVASRFNISSIPAMLIFKGRQLQDQIIGLQPKHAIEQRLMALVER